MYSGGPKHLYLNIYHSMTGEVLVSNTLLDASIQNMLYTKHQFLYSYTAVDNVFLCPETNTIRTCS